MFIYLQSKAKSAFIPPPPPPLIQANYFYFPLNRDVFSCFIRYYYV